MKCPYRDFKECIVQECPACEYETKETVEYEGKAPYGMHYDEAVEKGYMWTRTKRKYIFKSCGLITKGVRPVLKPDTHIHNKTDVSVHHSIF